MSLSNEGLSGSGTAIGDILMFPEAEAYITSFSERPYTVKDIGSPRWLQYHEYVEKLSQQAVLSATMKSNEFVMELLVEHEKLGVLIADVIGVELWREKVFNAVILKMDSTQFSPKSTLPLYMTLYHEACVLSLLETVLYHTDAMQSAGESGALLDLCDYCQRQLVFLSTCDQSDTDAIYDPKLSIQREDESDIQVFMSYIWL
ncbi:zinc finger MYND domain-containing protein 10-like [Convolutriloba macropyga]|uniref:zinc finger MYND domain-containing protein 10-like n=1 Tax=Convolutriloba macropyga TaxID=536237 RepID=UPI003F51EA83